MGSRHSAGGGTDRESSTETARIMLVGDQIDDVAIIDAVEGTGSVDGRPLKDLLKGLAQV